MPDARDPGEPGGSAGADLESRLAGTLLGTALGDAFGMACEGLSRTAIARRFGPDGPRDFALLGRTGFVSDDTEQAALVAQCLAQHPRDSGACARAFRGALLAWCARLPWGVGRATLRACARIALGLPRSGVSSAGNGAAMRAAVIGVTFRDDPEARRRFGRALAEVTHVDDRAVQGALYVAEVAAHVAQAGKPASCPIPGLQARKPAPPAAALTACEAALSEVSAPPLRAALEQALQLAAREADPLAAAATLNTTGYVVHTAAFATFCFARFGGDPLAAIREVTRAGGDTDSIAAIVGAWAGALGGEECLPRDALRRIHDGPFGPTHLRALAACLARRHAGEPVAVPRFSAPAALARNLALYPVILAHAFRRWLPF